MTTPTTRAEIVGYYFERLTASDVEAIVGLFADDGTVESPGSRQCPLPLSLRRSTTPQSETS